MFSNETAELLYSTTVGPFCSKNKSQDFLFHKKFKFSYKKKNSLNGFKSDLLLNKQFIFGSNIHSWNTVKRAKTLALCSSLLGQFVHNALEHNMELFEMFCLLHKSSTNMSAIVESICVCVCVCCGIIQAPAGSSSSQQLIQLSSVVKEKLETMLALDSRNTPSTTSEMQ